MDYILKLMRLRAPTTISAPDFTQSVMVVLQTFAVLVGVSITDFLDESKNLFPEAQRPWLLFALIALLLRYIIGSAIHLNYIYGNTDPPTPGRPRSHSVMSFLKDLSFLVVFGWLAVRITHTNDLDDFLWRSMEFVGAGFGWSISDPIWRSIFPSTAPQRPLWRAWALLDGLQLAIIYAFIDAHDAYPTYGDQLAAGVGLAYILFLFLDFSAMIRGLRIT